MVDENVIDGFSMEEWFDSSETVDTVTMTQFDSYVEEYLKERANADELELKLTEQNKRLMKMSTKLMAYLDTMGKTKHVTASGTIQKIETSSWKPTDGEGREEIIQHLKDIGQYDNITAFNANKFSSWYKTEREANPDFNLQGVEQKVTKYIKFQKTKG